MRDLGTVLRGRSRGVVGRRNSCVSLPPHCTPDVNALQTVAHSTLILGRPHKNTSKGYLIRASHMMSLRRSKTPWSPVEFLKIDAGNDIFVPEVEVCPLAVDSY